MADPTIEALFCNRTTPGRLIITLGKTTIGYYLGQTSVGLAYGAAGSMVVLLARVYYSALIMFFGAEFTHAWSTRHGSVTPQSHAVSGAAAQTKSEALNDPLRGQDHVRRLAEQLAEPYSKQLTDFQKGEQICPDQIRVLTDTITALAKQRQQPYTLPGIEAALVKLQQRETAHDQG